MLPDLAVRLAVLHLQELPPTHQEREAVIRWRLGQEQLLSLTGARVFFQVVSTAVISGECRNTILAVVAQEAVLEQYETMCEAAGLLPQQVEVASLALFNMWVRTAGGLDCVKSDFLWVNIADRGFTAFIFHKRELVFIRTKPQGIGVHDKDNVEGVQSPWVEKVIEECAASLYACQQHHPGLAVTNLILVGDGARHAGFWDKLERDLGLSVKEMGWEDVPPPGGNPPGTGSMVALPALAGVV
jgi:Tfp pilus assembly PilM family ATPase